MRTAKITEETLESLTTPIGSSRTYWDEEFKKFGVLVEGFNSRVFIVRSQRKNESTSYHRIGSAEYLSVDQAKSMAMSYLITETPLNRVKATNLTVLELCGLFIERYAKVHNKSWKIQEGICRLYIIPYWGDRKINSIRRSDMQELHTELGKTKPYQANRVREIVSKMWNLAELWEYVPSHYPNPAKGIREYREFSRDRFLSAEEVRRLYIAMRKLDTSPFIELAITIMLLTGMRKTEVLKLKWTDIDFERKEIRLAETKSGRKHYVPISDLLKMYLLSAKRTNQWVIPAGRYGEIDKPRNTITKAWKRIRKEAGLQDVWLHDLRRTVGAWLACSGNSLLLISKILNHTSPHVTEVYARFHKQPLQDAMESHSKEFAAALGIDWDEVSSAETDKPAQVVEVLEVI